LKMMMLLAFLSLGYIAAMPLPFKRELYLTQPQLSGNDVIIAQNLLLREPAVTSLSANGVFDSASETAVKQFQTANNLVVTGILDDASANLLLSLYSADGVKDTGFTAGSLGYLYKIVIPVYENRSIETSPTLYDAYNNVLLTFPARTHGHRNFVSSAAWPDFGNGDYGLNQFTSNGNTITGIVEMDLNSPEPDPAEYGPWPVNRIVRGLEGNAAFLLPYIRDGQLIHTGNWTSGGWTPSHTMPNSAGCVHSHPEHVERIYNILVDIGVTVNPNTYSGKNYPYKPQGIGVIQLLN